MVADGVLLTMWSKKNPYLLKNYGTGRPQLWNSFHIKTMFNILGGNTSAGSKDKGLWFQRWMGNQMRDIWSSPSNTLWGGRWSENTFYVWNINIKRVISWDGYLLWLDLRKHAENEPSRCSSGWRVWSWFPRNCIVRTKITFSCRGKSSS